MAINGNPKDKWYEDFQEFQEQQFDDASTVQYDIEEEIDFGTLEFKPIRARLTTIIDVKTGQRNGDDFRKITFFDYKHRPAPGTRYRFDDNIWIVFATKNLKVSSSSVYVYRCNHTLNTQDRYGNIHREPVYVDYKLNETQLSQGEQIIVPSGRLNIVAQLNDWTKDWKIDKRFIIGDDPYRIRYRSKHEREQTFVQDSRHVVQFYVEYDNEAVNDNLDLQVADYLDYNFAIQCESKIANSAGSTGTITSSVTLNGQKVTEPLIYYSNNESVITVDSDGNYTCVADGETTITVQMKNKPSCITTIEVVVGENEQSVRVYPETHKIRLNEEVSYTITSKDEVTITADSENPSYYYKFTVTGSNSFTIKNLKQSKYPVIITYSVGDITGTFEITLGGII